MADSTEGVTNLQYLGLLVPALIALIVGLVIHSFIIGVNVNDWWKGRSLTSVDHIVTCLEITRMCTQCVNTLYLFVDSLLLRRLDSHVLLNIIDVVIVFFTYANTWLTSLLSVVFCLKISNLHSKLFLYLRGVILHRTVHFIVVSVLLSILNCLMRFLLDIPKGGKYNTTTDNLFLGCMDIYFIYIYTIADFIPLLFYYISSVLVFTSLYHHTTKIKMSSNLTVNLETYYSVMKFVSISSIYITLYFTCYFVCALYHNLYCVNLLWLYIVLDFLPAIHSSYLIFRTAKLRNQMSKILQNVFDLLTQRKPAKN